jgi:hypothetical protein
VQGKEAPASSGGDMSDMVDKLAKSTFSSADRDHDKKLNKEEFQVAQTKLTKAVDTWGRQGLIGKLQKPAIKAKHDLQETSTGSSEKSPDKLSRNPVSEDEFRRYAYQVVDDADQKWRTIHAEAQRKAAMQRAQRQQHNGRPKRYPLLK